MTTNPCSGRHVAGLWLVFRALCQMAAMLAGFSLCATAWGQSAAAAAAKWEYCEVRLAGSTLEGGRATGSVTISYAVEDGWRTETVSVVQSAAPSRKGAEGTEILAAGKALSLLGRQGWELISVTFEIPENWRSRVYYLKRQAR